MPYNQPPPQLGNQYADDSALRGLLRRSLPASVLQLLEPRLHTLGALAGGELYAQQLAERALEPTLRQWDAWGNRIDEITLTPLWRRARELALEYGLVSTAYDTELGIHARTVQFALVYLFGASTDVYSCPLAMTDGAARALLASGNRDLIEHAVPRLVSRDPRQFWTSGQWMTESTGGSDVGRSETSAKLGSDGAWRLYGRKWFTSAATSDMALTLARPEGNAAGGRGLALFYLETRDAAGAYNGIALHRLKDKLGTRKVPTAELTLDACVALPVIGLNDGVKHIAPMLNITRLWNSVVAVSFMRRALALARDYAWRRSAFGATLADKALHVDTLAGLEAEAQAALHLTFHAVALLGQEEQGGGSDAQRALLRVLTPIVKLTTGKQVVAVVSDAIECFGGAGYVEDTGLPLLLRDAQVLPIWEGTTNVLALDALRAIGTDSARALAELMAECCANITHERLQRTALKIRASYEALEAWRERGYGDSAALPDAREADARRYALSLGRTLAAALLCKHAQWALQFDSDARGIYACERFVANGINALVSFDVSDSRALALQ